MRFAIAMTLFLLGGVAFAGNSLQLAVGSAVACVLRESLWTGGDTAVNCWGTGGLGVEAGKELPVPTLDHAVKIAATRATVCALLADHKLQCWAYTSDTSGKGFVARIEQVFGSLTDIVGIAGGPLDICVIDTYEGTKCVHDAAYVTTPSDNIEGPVFKPPRPYLASGGGGIACTVGLDRQGYCWPTEKNSCTRQEDLTPLPGLTDPNELSAAPGQYQGCRACVIDEKNVRCWGANEHYLDHIGPSGLKDPKQLTQIDLKRHGGAQVQPCVIDEDRVKCRKDDGSFVPNPDYAGLVHPVALAGTDSTQCAANDETLLCYFSDGPSEHTVRVAHGMWFRPFVLEDLPKALDNAAKSTYANKAALFSKGAALLRADSTLAPFLLAALEPIVQGADSEFFEKFVQPNWQRLRKETGARALRELLAVDNARRAALALLTEGLPLLKKSEPANRDWEAVLPALADAIAQNGAPAACQPLARALAPLEPGLNALLPSARDYALARFAISLVEGLVP